MMARALLGLVLFVGPAQAWTCVLSLDSCAIGCEDMTVAFEIDQTQFAPPVSQNDPPRRQITQVTLNGARFTAQALRFDGGQEGFYEDAGALGQRLMIVNPNGAARLSLRPQNEIWVGSCQRG